MPTLDEKNISKSIVRSLVPLFPSLLPLLAFFPFPTSHPSFFLSFNNSTSSSIQLFLKLKGKTWTKIAYICHKDKMSNTIAALHLDPQLRVEGIKKIERENIGGFHLFFYLYSIYRKSRMPFFTDYTPFLNVNIFFYITKRCSPIAK